MMSTMFISQWGAWRLFERAALTALMLALCAPALAGPGAHGPGGEHLDSAATHGAGGSTSPRIEAKSELFELVSVLSGDELSTLINRFETNEPVLGARVEVAMGTLKAAAKFHADHGDYSVDDAAFLKALAIPGEHALIFTIVAGSESDLLDGTLTVNAVPGEPARGHGHFFEYAAIATGVTAVLVIALGLWRRRSRRRTAYATAGRLS